MASETAALSIIVAVVLTMFAVMFVLRKLHQPHVISYILVGVLLGPSALGLIENSSVLSLLGDLGIILLLFFIGMHISLPKLVKGWRIAVIGTLLQILASVGAVWLIGHFLDWPLPRIILLGFVISLSSTAILLKILEEWGELKARIGQDVVSILLVQDVAIVGMLIILSFLSPGDRTASSILLPLIGGLLLIGLLIHILRRRTITLITLKYFKGDHELELVAALIFCFGFAFVTGLFHLSTALGAFVAGIILSVAKETEWVHDHLYPLQIITMALFFVYIGLLLNLSFIFENLWTVLGLVAGVLLTNTVINMLILRGLGRPWRTAFYGGALLSQIGEFSFLLAAVGLSTGVILDFGYQMTLAVISIGLLCTPVYIMLVKRIASPRGLHRA